MATIEVVPTGNGVTDTDNLQSALDSANNGDVILLKAKNNTGLPTKFLIAKSWSSKSQVVASDGTVSYFEDWRNPRTGSPPLYQILSLKLLSNKTVTIRGEDLGGGVKTTVTQFSSYNDYKSWKLSAAYGTGAFATESFGMWDFMLISGVAGSRVNIENIDFELCSGLLITCLFNMNNCKFTKTLGLTAHIDNYQSFGLSFDPNVPDFSLPLNRCLVSEVTMVDCSHEMDMEGSGIDVDHCHFINTTFSDTMLTDGTLQYSDDGLGGQGIPGTYSLWRIFMGGFGAYQFFPSALNIKHCYNSTVKYCDFSEQSTGRTRVFDIRTAAYDGGITQHCQVYNNTLTNCKPDGWAIIGQGFRHSDLLPGAEYTNNEICNNVMDGCTQGLALSRPRLGTFAITDNVIARNTFNNMIDVYNFQNGLGIFINRTTRTLSSRNDFSLSNIPPQHQTHNPDNCCLEALNSYGLLIDELGSWPSEGLGIGQWVTLFNCTATHVVGVGNLNNNSLTVTEIEQEDTLRRKP